MFSVFTFGQKRSISDFYINSIDSLINKQLHFQKENRNSEAFVFLKDSMINYYYDDVEDPCENQPIKSYYTYDEFGYVTSLIVKNTPWDGCDATKSKRLYTYEDFNLIDRLYQHYDFDLNVWINSSKTTYLYDENNHAIEEIRLSWNIETSSWDNYLKYNNIYDDNLRIEQKRFRWDLSINDWFWDLSYTNSYDSNNNLLEYIYRLWNSGINDWETLRKTTNTYDTNTNLIENIRYKKHSNETQYEWNTIDKINYTYDASNFVIEEFTFKDWNNSAEDWGTKKKFDFENDSDGNTLETQEYLWNESNSIWKNESFTTNTYNSNNDILISIRQVWQINSWVNSRKETNTFNTVFKLTEKLKQLWDSSNTDWVNDFLTSKIYNEFNNTLETKDESWYNGAWYLEGIENLEYDEHQNLIHNHGYWEFEGWNLYYYYSEYDIILSVDEILIHNNYSIVPNPSNDYITINGLEQNVNIIFYDILGRRVLETNSENKIDISGFKNGLYFIKIIIEDSIFFKKFLKN